MQKVKHNNSKKLRIYRFICLDFASNISKCFPVKIIIIIYCRAYVGKLRSVGAHLFLEQTVRIRMFVKIYVSSSHSFSLFTFHEPPEVKLAEMKFKSNNINIAV